MILKISAAVALALACSAPALASDLTTTVNVQNGVTAGVVMNVAGSSSARDAFLHLMFETLCQVGTFDMYRASPTGGADFRAYSCRIINSPGDLGAAANQLAVVYYRAEGGSAWGPVPMSQRAASAPYYLLSNDIAITRLNVDNSCTGTVTAPEGYTIHNCPIPANDYQISTDTSSSNDTNFVLDTVDLGVSDEEITMYKGIQFPTVSSRLTVISPSLRDGFLDQLAPYSAVGFGQVFGVIVNDTTGPLAGATNAARRGLGKSLVANIFNGTYTNWNQVMSANGSLVSGTSVPIKVCRREPGSGAQVAAHQYFLGTTVCDPSAPNGTFVTDGADADNVSFAADTDGVIERANSGDLGNCVASLPGAIGFIIGNAAPAGTAWLAVGNNIPSRNNAAAAINEFWFENSFTYNPRLSAGAVLDLALGARQLARLASATPNVPSAIALPDVNNDPLGQGAFQSGVVPISIATRDGNSCNPIVPIGP